MLTVLFHDHECEGEKATMRRLLTADVQEGEGRGEREVGRGAHGRVRHR